MTKTFITIEDDEGVVNIKAEFSPPWTDLRTASPSQLMAIQALAALRKLYDPNAEIKVNESLIEQHLTSSSSSSVS